MFFEIIIVVQMSIKASKNNNSKNELRIKTNNIQVSPKEVIFININSPINNHKILLKCKPLLFNNPISFFSRV